MSIPAIEPIYHERPSGQAKADELGRDQFLTLLIAQLQYQDPLNPLDGTDFAAQLAQFSSLEQLFGVNDKLTNIQDALASQESGNILDYIGRTVKTLDNTIFVKAGEAESGTYALEDRADVKIFVYDEDGHEVRRLYTGWQDAGEHDLDWDGRDNAGTTVSDGIYTFEVEAVSDQGFIVSHNPYVTGEVTGVTYEGGIPYLIVGDKLITPNNVVEVRM